MRKIAVLVAIFIYDLVVQLEYKEILFVMFVVACTD